jgi:hypothetical protein
MVLAAALVYFIIRFFLAEIFRRYTVHRGMWHSVPAALIAGMFAFLIMSSEDITLRMFKTLAVVVGFMSHLILDEIWSVEFRRGNYSFKSSFGTALKLWGNNSWANVLTWSKLDCWDCWSGRTKDLWRDSASRRQTCHIRPPN